METDARPAFAALLREYRRDRGVTQEALAEATGLSREAISLLERGARRAPHRDTLGVLARVLKLSADERERLLVAAVVGRATIPMTPNQSFSSTLPPRLTSLVGREREIAAVRDLVRTRRLVTLTGAGGVGKTSLALAGVADLKGRFAEGIFLIELAPLAVDQLVPPAVAAVFDVHERQGEPILATLSRALGETRRILVLDNREHVLFSTAQVVEDLLRACPNLHFLVTSREPLRIGAEVVWRVPPLTVPTDPHPAINEIAASEAVQLFVERARAMRPEFVLDESNGPVLAEICRRLDGIPLAIELAAARTNALSPQQIAHYLSDRFRLLTTGSRTALPRHQTLRATLDWSHNLLLEEERRLFHRLGVFVGGWTIEAAEAVCGEDVLDLLPSLVDKSLVQVEERDGQARFTMLETIREYALAHLVADGEADEVHSRHADWALALAETALPVLHTQEKHVAWLRIVGREFPNLRSALRWLCQPQDAERALRLAKALWLYWVAREDAADGRPLIEAVLALPDVSDYPATLAAVQHGAGHLAGQNLVAARAYYEAALAYHRQQGDPLELSINLTWLGAVATDQGDFEHAFPWLEEGLTLARNVGNPQELGFALFHLADTFRLLGDLDRARALFEESVSVYRNGGITQMLTGQARARLGAVVDDLGDDAQAAAIYREALTELGWYEDRGNVAFILEGLASLAAKAGQFARALRLMGCAERLREEIGGPPWVVGTRRNARTLELARGALSPDAAEAALAAGRAMTIQEAIAYALGDDTSPKDAG